VGNCDKIKDDAIVQLSDQLMGLTTGMQELKGATISVKVK
jgi:hypothetical protein